MDQENSMDKKRRKTTWEPMTAEQAAEAAKGLTFEKVWAILIKTDAQMEENSKKIREAQEETAKQLRESRQETQKQIEETQKQMQVSQKRMEKIITDLSKNIGGFGWEL